MNDTTYTAPVLSAKATAYILDVASVALLIASIVIYGRIDIKLNLMIAGLALGFALISLIYSAIHYIKERRRLSTC